MKILVNVTVPAISEQYDILLPDSLKIKNLIPLIAGAVEETSNHLFVSSGYEILCSIENNIRLDQHATFETYEIKNGDHLIMI